MLKTFKKAVMLCALAFLITSGPLFGQAESSPPPSYYDLRNIEGKTYVTSVKHQTGGTCWTHGTMAAIEGNMLVSGIWQQLVSQGIETGPEPNLAEYHLDWWNGFNSSYNEDIYPECLGLQVHYGGDYRVASAYLSRGEGAVRDVDGQSFTVAPTRFSDGFHRYYVRDIEWYTAGEKNRTINLLKSKIMQHGVMATCMFYDPEFIDSTYVHYQPAADGRDPNHSVAIVGWDDEKSTHALEPGAWLVKNSWSSGWGNEGYFWISYFDKWAGHHPEMGAVSFYNVEPMQYDHIYYHDYHGWRDTLTQIIEGMNAFTAGSEEEVEAVSFYTAADSVLYIARVYLDFSCDSLGNMRSSKSGTIFHSGFHTIDLDSSVRLSPGESFYVYLSLSDGGQPIDRTSIVPVLLGATASGDMVLSTAGRGESYVRHGLEWTDLYDYYMPENNHWKHTANLCIKALTNDVTQTGITDRSVTLPETFILYQNHPNPFNPSTTISYTVGKRERVMIRIFSETGREIRTLVNRVEAPGEKRVEWMGRDANGNEVASGVYICRMSAGNYIGIKKMVLIR